MRRILASLASLAGAVAAALSAVPGMEGFVAASRERARRRRLRDEALEDK